MPKSPTRFPIRLKIMVSLLVCITGVVSIISFVMANFFHDDKRAYMKDWISIAARSIAAESRSVLLGYGRQLDLAAEVHQPHHVERQVDDAEVDEDRRDQTPQLAVAHLLQSRQPRDAQAAIGDVASSKKSLEAALKLLEGLPATQRDDDAIAAMRERVAKTG